MTTDEFRRAYKILGEWPRETTDNWFLNNGWILNDTILGSPFWVEPQGLNDAFNSTGTDVVKQLTSISDEDLESILNGG